MSQFFVIHSETPQKRLILQAVKIIQSGGVVVYPTDSSYALGCKIGDKNAVNRIRMLRQLDDRHHFTLACKDLSDLGTYAKVDNSVYRTLKSLTPGPYTFLLKATREVPRRLQHAKRKTIGLRVPDNEIASALLEALGEPICTTTMQLPDESFAMTDPYEIKDILGHQLDLIIDGGYCDIESTTVIDFSEGVPSLVRMGKGEVTSLGLESS
ncbi:MAG: threonylcarbamoyl-AMP synthase [Gammaproteobacteria bacterium]|nr:threonylcarbamoyl-AMP synthase [Gammaproteobacteria bacterium]